MLARADQQVRELRNGVARVELDDFAVVARQSLAQLVEEDQLRRALSGLLRVKNQKYYF